MFLENLTTIASDTGRIFKEKQLQALKDNNTFKRIVQLALDPMTNFYIRKIPNYTPNPTGSATIDWAMDQLSALSTRSVTGHAGINHLVSILESVSPDDAIVVERIVTKDLRCGVSTATVNKIWKDLVQDFPCMLCTAVDDKNIKNIKWPAIAQVKYDGMRIMAVVANNSVELFTRNGKPLTTHGAFDEVFLAMADGHNVVYDGELLVTDKNGVVDRQTGNGIGNKAVKGTISKQETEHLKIVAWDRIPHGDFVKGVCKQEYVDRYNALQHDRLRFKGVVSVAPIMYVESADEASALFKKLHNQGEEGIIVKNAASKWENKRSKYQLKFKGEYECDLLCTDWVEGTGKNQGKLGNLVCVTDDKRLVTGVGSGFTDADRDMRPEDVIGKIIKVKYNGKIKNKSDDGYSLFLPVFIEVREDKTIADTIEDIQ